MAEQSKANRAKQNVAAVRGVESRLGTLEAEALHDRMRAGARLRAFREMRDGLRGVLGMELLGPVDPAANENGDDDDAIQRADGEPDTADRSEGSRAGEEGGESVPAD